MNKPYSGNGKPFVLALFAEKDKEKVLPVLETLEKKGLVLCGQDGNATEKQAKKACTTVAFLSENFARDTAKQQVFFTADAAGMPVIPVRLDSAKQSDILERSITAKNAILAERYSAEELASRIAGAESLNPPKRTPAQEKASRLQITLILTAALIALAALGYLIYRQVKGPEIPPVTPTPVITETPSPTPVPTATPEPTPSPTPIVPPEITEKYGIVDKDLNLITAVVIVGEKAIFHQPGQDDNRPDMNTVASRGFLEDGSIAWFSNEDGHQMIRTVYDDLEILSMMPQLHSLQIAMADVSGLPDMKSLKHLENVELSDCSLDSLDWLEGSAIEQFICDSCDNLDYSPLSACEKLATVRIDFNRCRSADLSAFAPPALKELMLQSGMENGFPVLDLNPLSACASLESLELNNLRIRNIQFAESLKNLLSLQIKNLDGLSDLSPLNGLAGLKELYIEDCSGIRDYSPIAGCTGLEDLNLHTSGGNNPIRNADWIANIPNIRNIGLYNCRLPDVNFLDSIPEYRDISFSFSGSLGDASALSRHKNYSSLHINPDNHDYTPFAELLKSATVSRMQLFDIRKIDLSTLPAVSDYLEILYGSLENLHGFDDIKMRNLNTLVLTDMQYLTSLEGVENLPMLGKRDGYFHLEVRGCPRLTDYSALEGRHLSGLVLSHTYMVPDLSAFRTEELELDYVEGLENLDCLEALDPANRIRLSVYVPNEINDLMPARNLRGDMLKVSPQLEEHARAFVEEGNFRQMEISYPDRWWEPNQNGFTLLNLEEIDTLPGIVLAKVRSLQLAGDRVVNPDTQWISKQWDEEKDTEIYLLVDRETGESAEIPAGTLTDLTRIEKLTGLKSLDITSQPLESLIGTGGMLELENICLYDCRKLSDISALFTLESLRDIQLEYVPVESIQGIQNLPELTRLKLSESNVTDLSPLAECNLSAAAQQGGLNLEIYGNNIIEDFSPLENIKTFGEISIFQNQENLLPHLQGASVYELNLNPQDDWEDLSLLSGITVRRLRIDCFSHLRSLHGLETSLQADGGMECLEILGCPRLADWSVLGSGPLGKLWLYSSFDIPDLSLYPIAELRLEQLNWLKDLSLLEPLAGKEINLELVNLPQLQDLSVLKKLKGERLAVSEDLQQKAQRYAGNFRSFEFAENDWWGPSRGTILRLEGLEELDSLPANVLKQVTTLQITEDHLLEPDHENYNHYWDDKRKKEIPTITDWNTQTQYEINMGSLADLDFLEKLENLECLWLICQPLESLEGIEKLTALQELRIEFCPNLSDLTPIFALPELQDFEFDYCDRLTSIEGIGALKKLRRLGVGSKVNDLSPLLEIDFSFCKKEMGGFAFSTINEKIRDFSPLSAVPAFTSLDLDGMQNNKWIDVVKDTRILGLNWSGFKNQKQFDAFVRDHPELERLMIVYTRSITDLSCLLELPNLKQLTVSRDMEKALQSLEGKEYSFELAIW